MSKLNLNPIKQRAQTAWRATDYATFSTILERGLDDFFPRLDISPQHCVLDVACGAGNFALRAAEVGATVTGIDFNPDALAAARSRAAEHDYAIQFDEGDIENMPYRSNAFDRAVSVFGIMFATDSERAAAELVRVCKPAGQFAITSWTPHSLVGELAQTLDRYKPAVAGTARKSDWGDKGTISRLFAAHTSHLSIKRRKWRYEFPYGVVGVVEFFRKYSGSHQPLFAQLPAAEQKALRHDLEQVWITYNQATDGTVQADAEYLEIVGTLKS